MKRNVIIGLIVAALLIGVIYIGTNRDNTPIVSDETDTTEETDTREEETESEEEVKPEDGQGFPEVEPEIVIGEKLPDFKLENLNGEQVSLSDYEDKILFINFWATWCGYCDEEMPDLQRIYEENEDVVVLTINVDEERAIVENYIAEGGYEFEVLLDKEGKISQKYMVGGLPASYFTDKDGLFLGNWPSMMTYEQMNEVVEEIRGN